MPTRRLTIAAATLALIAAAPIAWGQSAKRAPSPAAAETIHVGADAPAVTLPTYSGDEIDLGEAYADSKTVLVVLRGYPGYQCPLCSRQAGDYIKNASRFAAAGVNVVLVYPGPSAQLGSKAEEFLAGRSLPEPITLALDPDYELTEAYGLRWDAPRETAYPTTLVVEQGGRVGWATVSKTHGGRVAAKDALAAAK